MQAEASSARRGMPLHTRILIGLVLGASAGTAGNLFLPARSTKLPRDSVANASQIVTLDRALVTERVGRVSRPQLETILDGIALVLGR